MSRGIASLYRMQTHVMYQRRQIRIVELKEEIALEASGLRRKQVIKVKVNVYIFLQTSYLNYKFEAISRGASLNRTQYSIEKKIFSNL